VGHSRITVNAVAPGLVLSRPDDNVPHAPDFYRAVAATQAIPRHARPRRPRGPGAFLASDAAAAITGQTFCVRRRERDAVRTTPAQDHQRTAPGVHPDRAGVERLYRDGTAWLAGDDVERVAVMGEILGLARPMRSR